MTLKVAAAADSSGAPTRDSAVGAPPSIKFVGAIARLTRLLCLALLAIAVLPTADIKTSKMNVTSKHLAFGKRSDLERRGMQLESLASSNTCFSGGGCQGDFIGPTPPAICNPGTYVYKVIGFKANDILNAFTLVCSDGYNATIGRETSIVASIMSPGGFSSIQVVG